jgi:hypothetical protein
VKRIAIPALTAMITVVSFVAVGAWNRSAEPRLVVTLTERELPLWWGSTRDIEHQPLRLRLLFEPRHEPLDARNWLPETKLRELGFPLTIPAGDPGAADVYDNLPSRIAWIALEYDGPAWRDIQRRRELLAEQNRYPPIAASSRLVPVDAALDFDTLRVRYPSGHLIVRGVVGVTYVPPGAGGPVLHGTLRSIVPTSLAVPAHLRGGFLNLPENAGARPRYEVDVAIGRLGLPYLRSVRPVE